MALKLAARFSDRQFVSCARVSGKWTGEEVSTAYFPFIPDQPFRVTVTPVYTPSAVERLFLPDGDERMQTRK